MSHRIRLGSGDVVVCSKHDRPLEDNSPVWGCDGGGEGEPHYLVIDFGLEEGDDDFGSVEACDEARVRQVTDAECEEFGWTK